MRISLSSILVDDQDTALALYTECLGFAKKVDIPMGEFRWLTVVAPDHPEGPELVLEPNAHAAAARYQKELYGDGIPLTAFEVDDVEESHRRLRGRGVEFRTAPRDVGGTKIAVFDDTCGNLIQIYEVAD